MMYTGENKMRDRELLDKLEALVDSHNLDLVVETLANICFEKADHIRTNWQDEPLAKSWDRDGKTLQKTAEKLSN